ncbi:hypothetical protein [Dysgonomonas massiliensis]|uniref:hypothetical protein n=1 Tax=Dysgonomonas massiliensis TaxID=2040292 RepID=UPI0011AFBE4D|nr:hypothetical protein [Dysgonomonas massiliensis]
MKTTKYNKSEIMRKAWAIYKSGHSIYSMSFSASLERAWEIAKKNRSTEIRKAEEQVWANDWNNNNTSFDLNILAPTLSNYYANNTYNGD